MTIKHTLKKIENIISILIILIVFSSIISAHSEVNLLAASEELDVGGVILASLDTEEGSGKIYIESNVIISPDTQISIRLANEIICNNYDEVDCEDKDFYYSIKSKSNFITGPSAGSAFALLTYSELTNKKIPKNLALTGTINSGGYIGNVGGLTQKITGASQKNIKYVLIPFANKNYLDFKNINLTNESVENISKIINESKINLIDFGDRKSVV